jgi:hypothetical protein
MTDLQTPREYLVSLGLAKEGRGKFSAAAHAALEAATASGIVFAEKPKPEPKPRAVRVPKPAKPTIVVTVVKGPKPAAEGQTARPVPAALPKLREQRTFYALSPEGYRVGYDRCRKCMNPVSVCPCVSGPVAPNSCTPVAGFPRV